MRKFILSAVLLSSAFAAAPAAAQYRDYNRDYDRGYAYGHNQTRALDRQLMQIRQRIDSMYQRRLISPNEARNLSERAENLQRRLYDASRNGISPREHANLRYRIQELRQRLQRERFEGREQRRDDRYYDRRW